MSNRTIPSRVVYSKYYADQCFDHGAIFSQILDFLQPELEPGTESFQWELDLLQLKANESDLTIARLIPEGLTARDYFCRDRSVQENAEILAVGFYDREADLVHGVVFDEITLDSLQNPTDQNSPNFFLEVLKEPRRDYDC